MLFFCFIQTNVYDKLILFFVIYLFFNLFPLFRLDNLHSEVDKVSVNVFGNSDVLKIMNETNFHQQYSGNDGPHTIYFMVKQLNPVCMVKMIKQFTIIYRFKDKTTVLIINNNLVIFKFRRIQMWY